VQTELRTEVVLCPNCKGEVPKTLYCLNCGYPLYKVERKAPEEEVTVEVEDDPFAVDPLMDVVQDDVPIEVEPTIPESTYEVEVVTPVLDDGVEILVDDEPEEPKMVYELPVRVETPQLPYEVVQDEPFIIETPVIEEPVEPVVIEVEPEIEITDEVVDDVYAVEIPEPVVEPAPEPVEEDTGFEPDPVIRELMAGFAKNISMKIKLVNLNCNGEVKPETFERLFESYLARGERLMNSRNEKLERVKYDLDHRERALNEARIGLEELKIRKSIGDASDAEYYAKAPGYEWDISNYEEDVSRKRVETRYMEDLSWVLPTEDIDALKDEGRMAIEGLSSLEIMPLETVSKIRIALEDALSCLG